VKNSSPTRLEGGVLHVETTTSTWAQEISLLAPTILAKLAPALPKLKIESLRVKSGPYPKRPPADTSRPPKVAPLDERELPGELRTEISRLDEPLQSTVSRAARQSLAHRRSK
jgi:hypothetical protein